MSLLRNAGRGAAPAVEMMPQPDIRMLVPMRDGVRLDTYVWLPAGGVPAPAIMWRTPYREEVLGWARLGLMRYVEEGYAFVCQLIRGTGESEGEFQFSSPYERSDGYDAVEWIAAQPWCDSKVGMDGGSYVGLTQYLAASARPPHLKCMIPHVTAADYFQEIPYYGGCFSRLHTLNWLNLISARSPADLTGGFISAMPILSQADWLRRLTMRPVKDAADDLLEGDKLAHYRDSLDHPTFDHWWKAKTMSAADYAAMDLPTLIVTGNFDWSIGTMTAWNGLMAHAGDRDDRQLLIGPWDHGQVFLGGGDRYGPFDLDADLGADPFPIRLAFFDRHLKGKGDGPDLGGKAKVYITGRNEYRSFSAFPPREARRLDLFLSSGGNANGERGDGRLVASQGQGPADRMQADPDTPFIPTLADAMGRFLDLTEHARHIDTLVYATEPFEEKLTIVGEAELVLHVAVDAPDADIAAYLAEIRPDGTIAQLAQHALRLRYREGFDREVLLTPGVKVEARLKLTLVCHELAPGQRLALLLRPDMFPLIDPNPNTGEPIATAVGMRKAMLSIFHDAGSPSRLELPVL
ncbi:CocE/NonD family hydrolase [Sphingosinicella rhizophila]|uniref:CocE/NonD family hydrolase n=1 Tax=Sphingosinicella rhizophila TaxID=3050082 RepID=A0ABU3QA57_9SPHN|nr:CocE/NonD family hydrolase [Sphingosinicella sp. GR2756]MDT9600207.1 CocE/NonD family hydrolase [Sphingosinicella sp. GR2756]